ncbi:MAG: hypothetical protein AB7Y74_01755 [Syntrophorhabdus sp.]
MRIWLCLNLLFFFLFLLVMPFPVSAQKTNSISIGYKFKFLSSHKFIGQIEEGHYDFVHVTYQYERSLSKVIAFLFEPFASYTFTPKEGVDARITLSLKYNFHKKEQIVFF